MKKSTVIIIFIIYVASIVIIGFFGMKVKVYDEMKYIEKIEISVESKETDMFELQLLPTKDATTQNDVYNLKVFLTDKGLEDNFFDEETQTDIARKYLPIRFIPKIIYDTGEEDYKGVAYSVSNQKLIENNSIDLQDDNGTLICFKPKIAFYIYINPTSNAKHGSGAIVHVFVI